MSIFPLPQFEADLEADKRAYEKLKVPTSIVVRFGAMKMVGEFPYSGDKKPGCGSKLVVRTHRGVELGEMLTSTCPNAGCSKSVTRQEMLEYIENSGGREYPFFTEGRVLRIATVEDVQRQSALDSTKRDLVKTARARVAELALDMKIVDAEPMLGGETLTFFFTAEERVDFRELVRLLAEDHRTRIELRQVGARDEARLTADYERCGQHCCCKQFLKVLKPVSMRSAKVQKSTLDPLKISGRCGRLMCCLRYEDETYETLRKRLPNRAKRVGTPEGPGSVVDTQILTQLVLVALEKDGRQIAVPVESLSDPEAPPPAPEEPAADPLRGMSEDRVRQRTQGQARPPVTAPVDARTPAPPGDRRPPGTGGKDAQQDAYRRRSQAEEGARDRNRRPEEAERPARGVEGQRPAGPKRRPSRTPPIAPPSAPGAPHEPHAGGAPGTPGATGVNDGENEGGQGGRRKKRRRRQGRRRRGPGEKGGDAPPTSPPDAPGGPNNSGGGGPAA